MTQSVVEKTSIPEKTWRRQTDSPSGWIAFACGSVILHLLAFWLISSYKLSASRSGSASAVPIEFIEISPEKPPTVKPQPKPKPANTTPKQAAKPIAPQNSQPVNPSATKPPVATNDRDAIAFDNQKIEQKLAEQQRQQELLQQQQQELAQKQQQELAQRQQQELAQRQQQELAQKQQQELAQKQQQELAQRQQQELAQRQQQELAQKQQQELAQRQQQELAQRQQQELAQRQQQELAQKQQQELAQRQQQNPLDGEKIADAPTDARGLTPPEQFKKAPQAAIPNQSNLSGGLLTASWKIDRDQPFQDEPDNLAQPLKRNNSNIPLAAPQDGNFQPGSFLVWLIIDNQGNASVTKIETPDIARKEEYRKYAEEIFNDQKFIPASENNGSKPDFSNLPIRVNIQDGLN